MSKYQKQSLHKSEQGIVSIVLTVFVLIVLSLVVVAFSQNTRRSQRQALDQQLSTQAFYAAESGVNKVVSKFLAGQLTTKKTTDCKEGVESADLDTDNTFTLSCLLYDSTPKDIQWTSVDTNSGQFVSLHTDGGAGIDTLKLTWTKDKDGNGVYSDCTNLAGVYSLPPLSGYPANCSAGLLRVQLIPYEAGLGRDQLAQKSFTVFLRPINGAASSTTPFAYNQPDADGVKMNKAILLPQAVPLMTAVRPLLRVFLQVEQSLCT